MSGRHSAACTASGVVVLEEEKSEETLVLRLSAPPPEERPHVTWAEGTVDNEHLGRLKSNCCCIYTKPRVWDDPSTWEQDEHETEHCRGHTLPPPPGKEGDDKEKKPSDGCHGSGCC